MPMIRILSYEDTSPAEIFAREDSGRSVSAPVSEIIQAVRREGDQALRRYALAFDKAELVELEVSPETLDAAVESLDGELRQILTQAAERIRAFHRHQVRSSF